MDILRSIADKDFKRYEKFLEEGHGCNTITILTATHSSGHRRAKVKREVDQNEEHLRKYFVRNLRQFIPDAGGERPDASLTLIFLPQRPQVKIRTTEGRDKEISGGINMTQSTFKDLFEYLEIEQALMTYILSSRTGWYSVSGPGVNYSFFLKDYMYMWAWSFNPKTMETRALVSARGDWGPRSGLKNDGDQSFDLPGLETNCLYLYHPLSCAFFGLADYMVYFEKLLVSKGYRIGDIEEETGHPVWDGQAGRNTAPKGTSSNPQPLEESRQIAQILGIFTNMAKSVETAEFLTKTLEDESKWQVWMRTNQDNQHYVDNYNECSSFFVDAISLISQRMITIKQSGHSTIQRATVQFRVLSAQIKRADAERKRHKDEMARIAYRESNDMKVIAMMTMAFLPATFFAALFAVPSLNFDTEKPDVPIVTKNFWLYWAFTLPTTLLVFVAWDMLTNLAKYRNLVTNIQSVCFPTGRGPRKQIGDV